MVEEGDDRRRVEVGDVKLARLLADFGLHELQQQSPGVAIRGNGVRADAALADEALGEVGLEGRGEPAHCFLPAARWRRSAASERSSGVADKYQNVWAGLV